jgi:hypothetical protein
MCKRYLCIISSVFKYDKLLKRHKPVEIKVFSYFFLLFEDLDSGPEPDRDPDPLLRIRIVEAQILTDPDLEHCYRRSVK